MKFFTKIKKRINTSQYLYAYINLKILKDLNLKISHNVIFQILDNNIIITRKSITVWIDNSIQPDEIAINFDIPTNLTYAYSIIPIENVKIAQYVEIVATKTDNNMKLLLSYDECQLLFYEIDKPLAIQTELTPLFLTNNIYVISQLNDEKSISENSEFYSINKYTKIRLVVSFDEVTSKILNRIKLDLSTLLTNFIEKVSEVEHFYVNKNIESKIMEIHDRIENKENYSQEFIRSILIHGPSGVGKTSLCSLIAKTCQLNQYVYVNCETIEALCEELDTSPKSFFRSFLNLPRYTDTKEVTFVVIDNIEMICGPDAQLKELNSQFIYFLDNITQTNVILACITSHVDLIPENLRKPGRMYYEIELSVPNRQERSHILSNLCNRKELVHPNFIENIEESYDICAATHGFTGGDLCNLLLHARINRSDDETNTQTCVKKVLNALMYVRPTAMKTELMDIPDVSWSDIGGLTDIKNELIRFVMWPMKYPLTFERYNITFNRGILLYGPPGCSKTLIAKALASQCKMNFFAIKGPEIFDKYVGESERMIRNLFKKARQVAPSLIFFDEIDAIAVERSSDKTSNSVGDRVLTQLLTEMDGIDRIPEVFILAATNRVDKIDKALLRPGRFGKVLHVPLPDYEARKKILEIRLTHAPLDTTNDKEKLLDELASLSHGFSGAEVSSIYNDAALIAMENDPHLDNMITMEHFRKAIYDTRQRNSKITASHSPIEVIGDLIDHLSIKPD